MYTHKRLYKSQKGANLVEYALLACCVCLVLIISVGSLGKKIEHVYCVKIGAEIGVTGASGVKTNPCTGEVITPDDEVTLD